MKRCKEVGFRGSSSLLVMMPATMLAAMSIYGEIAGFAAQPAVRRLDGSSISGGEIDATVSHLMSAAEVTGAGIAIFNGGKVAYSKTHGFRDRTLPLTEDSVMAAASFTKVVFTYLVM
jgi:CubicO group peptidase (beta-lactamase class C family)